MCERPGAALAALEAKLIPCKKGRGFRARSKPRGSLLSSDVLVLWRAAGAALEFSRRAEPLQKCPLVKAAQMHACRLARSALLLNNQCSIRQK